MFLDQNPLNENSTGRGDITPLRVVKVPKCKYSYLYIGDNKNSKYYLYSQFKSGVHAHNMDEALKYLSVIKKFKDELPDIIIIDIPFKKNQINSFFSFLKRNECLALIPLLYNESQLSGQNVLFIKKQKQIDDIVDIISWGINYDSKISFLKKLKKAEETNEKVMVDLMKFKNIKRKISIGKRVFDIFISLIGILCCLPLFILAAIAIKFDSKGPVIYKSLRAGQGFKVFSFYKFRTMQLNADKQIEELKHLNNYSKSENGIKFLKINNDPRVTQLGKLLRKLSLDELPQLFNVLIGDMSIVGNRPLPLYEAATLTTDVFVERFMAPAGITGLWQIKKKANPCMTAEERMNLDILYARNYSLLGDLNIIAKTPAALFQKCDV